MQQFQFGNGSGQQVITMKQVGPGYVIFFLDAPEPWPADLPVALGNAVHAWWRQMSASAPGFRVRNTSEIVKGGDLVAMHIWYD